MQIAFPQQTTSWVASIVFIGLRIESLLKFMLFLFIQLKMAIPRCPSSRADLDFCNLKERVPVRTDKWFWIKK